MFFFMWCFIWCGWIAGEIDITEKPVVPIKVFTEKELVKEMEKITSTLVPEKDWSHRISAMQRVEGLVIGGLSLLCLLCFSYIYVIKCVLKLFNKAYHYQVHQFSSTYVNMVLVSFFGNWYRFICHCNVIKFGMVNKKNSIV